MLEGAIRKLLSGFSSESVFLFLSLEGFINTFVLSFV